MRIPFPPGGMPTKASAAPAPPGAPAPTPYEEHHHYRFRHPDVKNTVKARQRSFRAIQVERDNTHIQRRLNELRREPASRFHAPTASSASSPSLSERTARAPREASTGVGRRRRSFVVHQPPGRRETEDRQTSLVAGGGQDADEGATRAALAAAAVLPAGCTRRTRR